MNGFIEISQWLRRRPNDEREDRLLRTSIRIGTIVRIEEDEHGKAIIEATWGSGTFKMKGEETYGEVIEMIGVVEVGPENGQDRPSNPLQPPGCF